MIRVPLSGNRTFISTGAPFSYPDWLPPEGAEDKSEQAILARVNLLWSRALRHRQSEIGRLKWIERHYSGFHYTDPRLNQRLEVTNLCFSTVETVWPIMVERRPRPEIMPREPMDADRADRLQAFASWLMDTGNFEETWRLNTRVKLKFGYNLWLVTVDPLTGMPYAVDWSPFDFYPEPGVRNMKNMEWFFLAAPIATRRLKAMFPDAADRIVPDAFVSPGYDVYIRPYAENFAMYSDRRDDVYGPTAYRETDPTPTTTTTYVLAGPAGYKMDQAETTFFIQLFIREYRTKKCFWPGSHLIPAPAGTSNPMPVRVPGMWHETNEPLCPSGWRVIQATPSVLLDDAPLDPAFDGLPIVLGYDYQSEGRLGGMGEVEQIIPLNRTINEQENVMNRAVRLSGAPVLLATKGSGVNFNHQGIEPGDVLEVNRGSEIKWLEYEGPSQHMFDHLANKYKRVDVVSGVHDVQQGERPAGIEAAAAIRELQDAAATRIRGKTPQSLDEMATVVRKMMSVAAKKLDPAITFMAQGGRLITVSRDELEGQYEIRFAEGSGTVAARRDRDDQNMQLFQMGAIPQAELLKQLDYPDADRVVAEAEQQQMLAAAAAPPPPPPGHGGPPK